MESSRPWRKLSTVERAACIGLAHDKRCCSQYAWDVEGALLEDWERRIQPGCERLVATNYSEIHRGGGAKAAIAIHLYLVGSSPEPIFASPAIILRSSNKSAAVRLKKLLQGHPCFQELDTGFDIKVAKLSAIKFRTGHTAYHNTSARPHMASGGLCGAQVYISGEPVTSESSWSAATAGPIFHHNGSYYTTIPWHSCFPEDHFNPSMDEEVLEDHDESDSGEISGDGSIVSDDEDIGSSTESTYDTLPLSHSNDNEKCPTTPVCGVYLRTGTGSLDDRTKGFGLERIFDINSASLVGRIRPTGEEPGSMSCHIRPDLDCILMEVQDSRLCGSGVLHTPAGATVEIRCDEICHEIPSEPVLIAASVSGVNEAIMSSAPSSVLLPWKSTPTRTWTLNFTLAPGDSGSPVVDKTGKLVGVAIASIPTANITYIIPATNILELLPPAVPLPADEGIAYAESNITSPKAVKTSESGDTSTMPPPTKIITRPHSVTETITIPRQSMRTMPLTALSSLREDEWQLGR
jgi:hypothetical protein